MSPDSASSSEGHSDPVWYGGNHPQTLFTLPGMDGETGLSLPSMVKIMKNKFYLDMEIGDITRREDFGPHFPPSQQVFTSLEGRTYQRVTLTTEADGKGERVECWERVG